MYFEDELPCGGYQNEDKKIEQEIKLVAEGEECGEKEKKCAEKEGGCGGCECTPAPKVEANSRNCKKDKCAGRAVLLHKGEPICQGCLFKNIEYKTRLVLENSFKVNKNSNLLVCFSGGPSSACLVSILVNIVRRYQKNKLFNRLGCLHVQQQAALPEGFAERFRQETGVELDIVGIEEIMREGERSLDNVRELLKQFSNNANTIDLITVFRDRLISDFAQKHNYDFVLKGLNGDSLAAESFCYFAKGLGGNLPGLCVSDQAKSPFYYPLRGHSRKQLQYYYYVRKVSALAIKSEPDNLENTATSQLNDQIKGFIDTLQQMYSHTAPAIVRTAEKIQTTLLPTCQVCNWCRLPGAEDSGLCRRCLRVWEGRKKKASLESFPLQLPQ